MRARTHTHTQRQDLPPALHCLRTARLVNTDFSVNLFFSNRGGDVAPVSRGQWRTGRDTRREACALRHRARPGYVGVRRHVRPAAQERLLEVQLR